MNYVDFLKKYIKPSRAPLIISGVFLAAGIIFGTRSLSTVTLYNLKCFFSCS